MKPTAGVKHRRATTICVLRPRTPQIWQQDPTTSTQEADSTHAIAKTTEYNQRWADSEITYR